MNGYGGTCMIGEKFLKEWQVTDKNYWVNFFPIFIQPFTNDPNSKNNNLQVFENSQMDIRENSQMDMRGCVWVGVNFYAMSSDR